MTFNDVLNKFRAESFTQKDKGTQFERLMRSWLLSDSRYAIQCSQSLIFEDRNSCSKEHHNPTYGFDVLHTVDIVSSPPKLNL